MPAHQFSAFTISDTVFVEYMLNKVISAHLVVFYLNGYSAHMNRCLSVSSHSVNTPVACEPLLLEMRT